MPFTSLFHYWGFWLGMMCRPFPWFYHGNDDSDTSRSLTLGLDSIYYQAFPCLRIVQPGEFSIGPHADVALWQLSGLWPWPMTETVADVHCFHEATKKS